MNLLLEKYISYEFSAVPVSHSSLNKVAALTFRFSATGLIDDGIGDGLKSIRITKI